MNWGLRGVCVCVFGVLPLTAVSGEPISERQARELSPAVAKIQLQRAMTTALLHQCGQHYPRLQAAGAEAATHWLEANRPVLRKTDALRQRLLQSIQQQQSRFAAEKFALDIDRAIEQNVQRIAQNMAAYPPAQQQSLCNHLILAIKAGDWDLQHKQAEAFALVQKFH
jgi:hypothetical protein